ncbi:MAG TPA: YkvA family protein [Rectinemataceae bacterium]|nr:YkvA family protein [Rectinemataceae bacterium]
MRPRPSPGSGRRTWTARLRRRASKLKRRTWIAFLALKDPGTPPLARIVIALAVAYAASPIDLIPDFIPVLGQLDDFVIVPALIALALGMIPPEVAARCRREAWRRARAGDRIGGKSGIAAAASFALLWCAAAAWILCAIFRKR